RGAGHHDLGADRLARGVEPPRDDVGLAGGNGPGPGHDEVALVVHGHRRLLFVLEVGGDHDLGAGLGAGGVEALGVDVVLGAGGRVGPDDHRAAVGGGGRVGPELVQGG